jgi:hypothetical protein
MSAGRARRGRRANRDGLLELVTADADRRIIITVLENAPVVAAMLLAWFIDGNDPWG